MSAKVMDVMTRKVVAVHTNAAHLIHDGIVTLAGSPETARLGYDIVAAVRHLEGVVAVRDRLSYPVPAE